MTGLSKLKLGFQFFLISTFGLSGLGRLHTPFSSSLFRRPFSANMYLLLFLSVLPYFDVARSIHDRIAMAFSSSLFRLRIIELKNLIITFQFFLISTEEDEEEDKEQVAFSSSLFRRFISYLK